MQSELSRVTWPLPWWVVVAPGLGIAAVAIAVMWRPFDWVYVSPSWVSGLPAESLMTVGPFASICACWIAERFVNRNSPLASPVRPRSRASLGLGVLGVLSLHWALVFAVAVAGAGWFWSTRSTGGSFEAIEYALAIMRLEFFVVSGYLIGVVVARWWASLVTLAWSIFWVIVAPIQYVLLLPERTTGLEQYMFPGIAAGSHPGLDWQVLLVVAAWWIGVLVALLMMVAGSLANVARYTRRAFRAGLVAIAVVVTAGMTLPVLLPSPFLTNPLLPLSCEQGRVLEVCVTGEQEPTLAILVSEADRALERMGRHLPDDLQTVASGDAVAAVVDSGLDPEQVVAVNVGVSGTDDVTFDVGAHLGGLGACTGGDSANQWTFNFASWFAPASVYGPPAEYNPLTEHDRATVLSWYAENEGALRSCSYTGDGP